MAKIVDDGGHEVKGETADEPSSKPIHAIREPVRDEQVLNAVKFLSHPKVRGSPVIYRRSFLEKKGLTKEEIDEAFRRVPVRCPTYLFFVLLLSVYSSCMGNVNSSSAFRCK